MSNLRRFEITGIEIKNSFIDIFVNSESREIHILDRDEPERRTVTNNAHYNFFAEIDETLKKVFQNFYTDSIMNYEFYLYGTDGIVSRYYLESESFGPVDPFAALYEPYNAITRARYADHFFGGEKPEEKRKWASLLIAKERAEIEREQEIESRAEIDAFNEANGFD